MTAPEVYELATQGGATTFAKMIRACESVGPYCLIGDLAVNCYVEPIYTLDVEIVVVAENLPDLSTFAAGITLATASKLRIQFATHERYQAFRARCVEAGVLGMRVKVACLEDVTRGKLWAYSDPLRRLSRRKKTNWT